MTEANLDLQPSWPSYQSHEQVFCLHRLAMSVHNFSRKQLHTYLATIGPTSSVAKFKKVCMQLRKSQVYTYLGSAGHLVKECNEVCAQF